MTLSLCVHSFSKIDVETNGNENEDALFAFLFNYIKLGLHQSGFERNLYLNVESLWQKVSKLKMCFSYNS